MKYFSREYIFNNGGKHSVDYDYTDEIPIKSFSLKVVHTQNILEKKDIEKMVPQ